MSHKRNAAIWPLNQRHNEWFGQSGGFAGQPQGCYASLRDKALDPARQTRILKPYSISQQMLRLGVETEKLKQQDGDLLQVHGSWQLIQALLADDLIDEYRLWTFPVIVGSGKRLFEDGCSDRSLNLIKSEPCKNGAMMTIYKR